MNSLIERIARLESGAVLARPEAESLMEELLQGRLSTPEIVRFLQAFNQRAVTAGELAGFAAVMRKHAAVVFADGQAPGGMVDTCGTGGDGAATFNISTAAAIVAAAAGATVAKHGNRAASSACGSADVVERLGVRIDLPIEKQGEAIREIGIGFLFARAAHSAARHAAEARRLVGVRTVFNLLGPLANPAGAQAQVVGVFSGEAVELVAATLVKLGVQRAMVVHGAGGLDEISPAGDTVVAEVTGRKITKRTLTPEDFRLPRAGPDELRGGSVERNAEILVKILDGEAGPKHDVVVMNAAAALVVAGVAKDFRQGAGVAAQAIASGAAKKKLAELAAFSNRP